MSDQQQTNPIQNLKQILVKAQSNDNNERNANEQQINQMMSQDNVSLIQMLMMVVNEQISGDQDPNSLMESKKARTLASIVFKNALYMGAFRNNEAPQHLNSVWFQIDAETQGHIKSALLTSLGGETNSACFDKDYMKDICLCISSIATIEIPTGNWDNFVDTMAEQGMQDQQQLFKFAGIYNLGLVMDILEPTDLKKDDYIKIWETMLSNINSENIELTLIVSQSIVRLASMSHVVFSDSNYKQKIMFSIFELTKIQNVEVVANTLQALIDIVRLNYESMDVFLNQLLEMTERLLCKVGDDDEELNKLGRLTIEVWNSLCEVEIERSKVPSVPDLKFMQQSNWQKLATLYCNCLQYTGFQVDDHSLEDDNDGAMCIASINGLNFLSQIAEQGQFLNMIFDFVQQYVQHSEQTGTKTWITDYICIMALNSSIDGPSQQQLHDKFSSILSWIFEHSNHQQPRVKCVTAHLLQQLAEYCPQLFCVGDEQMSLFYNWFIANSENQHHKIVIYTMQAMQSLFESIVTKSNFNINMMNQKFTDIVSIGIRNILKPEYIDQGHIIAIQDTVNTITEQCDFASLKDQLYSLCNNIIDLIQNQILSPGSQYTLEQKEHLINCFGGLLQVIIARLEVDKFDQHMYQKAMSIVQAISTQESMRQGMLLTLNGMINSMDAQNILSITEQTLTTIEETIEDAETKQYKFDVSCRRMAVGIVRDIVTGLQEKSVVHIQRIMNILNIVLESQELTTDVKIFAIGAIGDLCLMCEAQFFQYLEKTMNSLIMAGKMSIQESTANMVIEERDNINNLRVALVESLVGILNGIKSPSDQSIDLNTNQNKENLEHIKNMFYYIESLMNRDDILFTAELAYQVIDLYCDIKMLTSNPQEIDDPEEKRISEELGDLVSRSNIKAQLNTNFGPYENLIQASEEGRDALHRFFSNDENVAS